jgi:hypothetical protein
MGSIISEPMVGRAHLPALQDNKGLAQRHRNSEIPLGSWRQIAE